jgi:hypothetical protein
MIAPSFQDLKHTWIILVPLLFFEIPHVTPFVLRAITLIVYALCFQAALIGITLCIRRTLQYVQKQKIHT